VSRPITGTTAVAAVVGDPIAHSLSPLIHNAWIAAAGLDAVYVALRPGTHGLAGLVRGLAGGVMRGLNITAPFKEQALALAGTASERARRAGAANVLLFDGNGAVSADNTDGEGLMFALAEQADGFDPKARPALILGAGGAARGAAVALLEAGAPAVQILARSEPRATALAKALKGRVSLLPPAEIEKGLREAGLIINATPSTPEIDLSWTSAVVMDMVYRPCATAFLERARSCGLVTVDGLAMLIGQARPSFAALFGTPAPDLDVRALALDALEGGE
jgi:shikimate dehydrogenase